MSSHDAPPRALVFYPWDITLPQGARLLLLDYSRALRDAGFRLDLFTPTGTAQDLRVLDPAGELFERLFTPPEATICLPTGGAGGFPRNLMCQALLSDVDWRTTAAAASIASSGGYAIVAVHYTRYAPIRQYLPRGIRTVLFTYELDAVIAAQEEQVCAIPAPFGLRDEVELMRGFDIVTALGPADRARVAALAPDLPVIEAPFCASVEPRSRVPRRQANQLLIVSNRGRFFDLSFRWFYEKVWPTLRARRPGTRLTIAGWISDVARVLGADRDPAIDVKGLVDSVEPLYEAADVLLAPYYYGDGVKTKIIEALARGIPVVTTPPGLSNTRLVAGRDLIVAADAESYAAAVADLLDSAEARAAVSTAGAAYIRAWHRPADGHRELRNATQALVGTRQVTPPSATVGISTDLGEILRHLVAWAINRCASDGVARVALFGAGTHTQLLLPVWRALGGPSVSTIVVSGSPVHSTYLGLPVCALADLDRADVDGIVLSSARHEAEMAATCRDVWPDLPCYGIWAPSARLADEQLPTVSRRLALSSRIPIGASEGVEQGDRRPWPRTAGSLCATCEVSRS